MPGARATRWQARGPSPYAKGGGQPVPPRVSPSLAVVALPCSALVFSKGHDGVVSLAHLRVGTSLRTSCPLLPLLRNRTIQCMRHCVIVRDHEAQHRVSNPEPEGCKNSMLPTRVHRVQRTQQGTPCLTGGSSLFCVCAVLLCCAVRSFRMLWAVPCTLCVCSVLCCAVLCCAVLCCAVLCCAVLCYAVLCCAVLSCAVLCCPVLCALCVGTVYAPCCAVGT